MTTTFSIHTPKCMCCQKEGVIVVHDQKTYERALKWQRERYTYIQDAVPELSVDQREQMMTGTHPECWEEMFGEEDE